MDNSAFFDKNNKNESEFYDKIFSALKNEVEFDIGCIFFKKGRRYNLIYKKTFSKKDFDVQVFLNSPVYDLNKLKIDILIDSEKIGSYLILKRAPFSSDEKKKIKNYLNSYSDKIKNFEISNVFKNQLTILQGAFLKKNVLAKQLEKKNEELIEIDKLRSEFLANVSHELRTPLNSIIGFSTALKDEMIGSLNEKQKSFANKILSSAIHLTGLINDILDMTKIEAGIIKLNLQQNSLKEILEEVINIVEPLLFEKGIKIETDFKYIENFSCDRIKFRQIMYNLIGNAIKFSHPNSKIMVSCKKNKDKLVIKVQDFGVGILKKDQKRIFEKFVQLDNIYTKTTSSTGLGLTITSELVKLHKGTISIKSELNKGTAFTLKFPM